MKNTLFDEKIDGTIHLALGNGLPEVGGTNQSDIHWDIVKDLRPGGQILLDGAVGRRTAPGGSEPGRAMSSAGPLGLNSETEGETRCTR